MAVKTTCPISHKQFREHAKAVEVIINGTSLHARHPVGCGPA